MCSSHLHKSPSQNFNEKIKRDRKRNNMDKMFLCIQASNRKINSQLMVWGVLARTFQQLAFSSERDGSQNPRVFGIISVLTKLFEDNFYT